MRDQCCPMLQPDEAPEIAAEFAEAFAGSQPGGRSSEEGAAATASAAGGAEDGWPPQRLRRQASLKAILALSPLDFFKSVSDGDTTLLLDKHTFTGGACGRPCR